MQEDAVNILKDFHLQEIKNLSNIANTKTEVSTIFPSHIHQLSNISYWRCSSWEKRINPRDGLRQKATFLNYVKWYKILTF